MIIYDLYQTTVSDLSYVLFKHIITETQSVKYDHRSHATVLAWRATTSISILFLLLVLLYRGDE